MLLMMFVVHHWVYLLVLVPVLVPSGPTCPPCLTCLHKHRM
jgi:hypothetical protein